MERVTFAISIIFFWIKGSIEVDQRFVKTNVANTILGFIPAGRDQQNIPLKNISGAMLSTKYHLKPMVIGFIVFLIGFSSFSSSFMEGLFITAIGVLLFLSGIHTQLIIEKAGAPYVVEVPFFEKSKMASINNSIQHALANDTDKTDLNMFFDKKTEA